MITAQALQSPSEMPQDIRWMNAATAALAVVAVLLVLAGCFTVLMHQPYFVIHKLSIDGEMQRNNMATVRANVVPRMEGSYFMVDLARARAVFEAVPWVRRALVRRVWPNELRVTLEEHQPAAYWRHEDRDDQLVNQQGEVFDANLGDVEDQPLPALQGPVHATSDQARLMLTMLRKLQPVLAPLGADIDTLELTDRGSWTVKLEDEAVIELGRGETDELVARAERFVRTLPQLRQQYGEPLAYADLRYPQGYAVRLKGLSTVQNIQKGRLANAPQTP